MKAILIRDDKTLYQGETETPEPRGDEVLIEIHATAINRADLVQRQGFYPPPPGASQVMGLECAGRVVAVGETASRFREGDEVCALLAGGGYAEYAAVHEGSVLPLPEGFSFVEGACLPEVFATAWLNLFMEGALQAGEKVLVHAGASGVGTAAIQLCRSFGSPCFVTAGSDRKVEYCMELGAETGSNRHAGSFLEKAREFSGEAGVDVILDPVGAAYLEDNIHLLGLNGRLILIGLMGGSRAEIDLALLMRKRIRLIGSTLRARPVEEKARIMGQLLEKVWPKLGAGEIRPVLDSVYSIEQAEEAHERVASNETIGKVVMTLRGTPTKSPL